jgi:hypothetical protein
MRLMLSKSRGRIQDAGQQVDCGKAMTDGNCKFNLRTERSTLPFRVRLIERSAGAVSCPRQSLRPGVVLA